MQLQLAVDSIVEHSIQIAAMLSGGEHKLLKSVMHHWTLHSSTLCCVTLRCASLHAFMASAFIAALLK